MKWTRRWTILAVLVLLAVPVWWLGSPLFLMRAGNEAPPDGVTTVVATGAFVDGEPGHSASGAAILLTEGIR